MVVMVREKSGTKEESHGKSGNSDRLSKLKSTVSPPLKLNLIAVFGKILYQKVMENSGRSQGKMRVKDSGHPDMVSISIILKKIDL